MITEERRKTLRRRVLKGATIAFDRTSGIRCMVRNLSAGGACLELDCSVGIPREFVLVLDSDRSSFASRIVWTGPHHLGVAFR
jgi:hypothetical protein